ncbi:MAG: CRISPR-associated protein Csx16 [Candidatus Omnitrophota bacterium]|jgi:CRISPR-associated protein Csx16|nr:CRISPR-associated protein Csx16 [Dehalococcoidia bacterium]
MQEIEWSDKMRNRSRTPDLLVVRGSEWKKFRGEPIPGMVAIKSSRYHKNGKWSGTDYVLVPAEGVSLVDFCTPFEGWGSTWEDLCIALKPLCGEIDRMVLVRKIGEKAGGRFADAVARARENEAAMASVVAVPEEKKTIIVTRHPGALGWLRKHHPELGEVEVVSHASPDQIQGARVVGVLPVNLAALCGEYWHLSMEVPPDYRGKELSCEDMEHFRCAIEKFVVTKI